MGVPIKEIVNRLESLTGVNTVEAYPADHDFCSPDIIHVSGGVEEEIRKVINEALSDSERYIELGLGGYMLYRPLGTVSEDNGSTFDILGVADTSFEAALVEPAPHETASVGTVFRFDSDDDDIEVSVDREGVKAA